MTVMEEAVAIKKEYARRLELAATINREDGAQKIVVEGMLQSERDRRLWQLRHRYGVWKFDPESTEARFYLVWPIRLSWAKTRWSSRWFDWHGWQVCWSAQSVRAMGWTYHIGPVKVTFGRLKEFEVK